ncbi:MULTISPECIES: Arm DNA-binding domain-containing protein [unclassified Mesorhizobium]|uniref:Arm DNA-binding domain-containing protein n=1 Tax=unclassified Mesorhizobium TaxID=325217 RepID=UPI0021E1FC48|nr:MULTISPECIES: Arm DNA-binding domain-containing protein [unclassified Mesorhizobium]
MSLSDFACKNAKPKDKPYRLADGDGLYLLVRNNGSKLWQLRYRYLAPSLHGPFRAHVPAFAEASMPQFPHLAQFVCLSTRASWSGEFHRISANPRNGLTALRRVRNDRSSCHR